MRKRLLAIAIACGLLAVIGLTIMAYAGCPSPDGKVYTISGCTATFQRAPFGPGEWGLVVVDCGDLKTAYDYECSQDKCVIDVSVDGGHIIYLMQVGDNMILMDYPALVGQ